MQTPNARIMEQAARLSCLNGFPYQTEGAIELARAIESVCGDNARFAEQLVTAICDDGGRCPDQRGHGTGDGDGGRGAVRRGSDTRVDVRAVSARTGAAGIAEPQEGPGAGQEDSLAAHAMSRVGPRPRCRWLICWNIGT